MHVARQHAAVVVARRRRTVAYVASLCNDREMAWRIDPEGVEARALFEVAPVDDLRVLELGCGDGRLTFQLADKARSVLAVDPDADRIAAARSALRADLAEKVKLVVAGAAEIDVPSRKFDLALFSWSL